jgi:putative PEP-CTERM system TPR-repeat lipoprotein
MRVRMLPTPPLLPLFLVALISGCSSESSEEHILRAKAYIAESRLDSATIELKNALKKNQKSTEARWLLGQAYLELGDVDLASKELRQAEKLGWTPNDVIPALARALLAQGHYVQVRELSQRELDSASLAQLLSVQALSEFAQGDIELANRLIDRALQMQPNMVSIQLVEARILFGRDNLSGALSSLENVLETSPNSGPAWSLTGDIKMRQKSITDALEAYNKSIAYQPHNLTDRLKRALILLRMQNYDDALSDAEVLLGHSPDHPGGNYIKGLIQFQNKNYEQAIRPLSLAEPAWRTFPMVLFFLSSANMMVDKIELGAAYANRFFNVFPDNIAGRKLLATFRLKQEKYRSVQDLLSPVLESDPNDIDALILLANALLYDNKADEGIAALAKVVELQPESPTARVRLGVGLFLSGNSNEATRNIESALDLDPKFQQAGILLVLSHLQTEDYEAAIKSAKTFRRHNPANVISHNLLGKAYIASGQLEYARMSFEKALTISPGDLSASHELAQMATARGDLEESRQRYEAILSHNRSDLKAIIQLAIIDAKEGREEAMVRRLEQAMNEHPTILEPRLLLGRYYLSRGKPERLPPLFSTLSHWQRESPRVLKLLALSQISESEHQKAQYTLEQILRTTPETPEMHHLLAMATAGSGDATKSRAQLQKALALDENFLPSRVALARMDLAAGDTQNFNNHLDILHRLAPDAPDVLQLQAAAADIAGKLQEGVNFARSAYEAAPQTYTMLELANYQKLAGESPAALALMHEWVEQHPEDLPARLSLARELRLSGRYNDSARHYEAILEIAPDNLIALTNLSWHLRQSDNKRSSELAERAVQLAPDSPQVLDTVAIAAYFGQDYRRANRSIQRAIVRAPDNRGYRYHQAMIRVALGKSSEAIDILERLLQPKEEFPEENKARALLANLQR